MNKPKEKEIPPGQEPAGTKISEVRFEHLQETLGVGNRRPRISWTVQTSKSGWRQTGYEVRAYDYESSQPESQP